MSRNDFNIQFDVNPKQKINVVKVENGSGPVVQEYQFQKIVDKGQGNYNYTKEQYGPLATTDQERGQRETRDRRFSLNPLLREPLSVEQEEQKVIDQRVHEKIAEMTEQAKAEAAAQGYEEGLKQGYQEALRQMRAEASERLESFNLLVDQIENAKIEIFEANEKVLIDLVYRVARTVLLRELTTDRQYIVRLAQSLVERVGIKESITLKLNPDDESTIEMLNEGLEKNLGKLTNLKIETSALIPPGGCQVETDLNVIEAHIEDQLQSLQDALLGKNSESEG